MTLSSKQLQYLRGLAHKTKPVVIVGDKGLTKSVLEEIENALAHHEFIKVRIRAERGQRRQWIEDIQAACQAERVHAIGQVACFYRKNPKKQVVTFPAS